MIIDFFILGGMILKKKNIIILIIGVFIIGIIIFFTFFNNKTAKNLKIGNNTSSQEIVDYILNISSYQATVEVEIKSNKNNNRYLLKQEQKTPETSSQEVLEPSNIAGIKISKEKNQLKLENTKLSISSIYEDYQEIADNNLDLSTFIKNYKEDSNAKWKEQNDEIIMTTQTDKEEKTLKVSRKTGRPTKLEIKGTNKKNEIYISYNEVKLNN